MIHIPFLREAWAFANPPSFVARDVSCHDF